ncbi:hypothetical protein [Desulfatibacillum aliphaticivorans]|uniref:hypothetical protein n=1 Tax=Desulfatibacillum aliphaticivorans TaxID=218208 RepID=UPI0004156B50|nr:hypothetical protein [Desulfatibacillum aliphaticivorans]
MRLPNKCLVDINVPKNANLATNPDPDSDAPNACILACVEAVEHVVEKRGLVIDDGDEIFDEYRRQLAIKGQPGVGDRFIKWVHDNRWKFPKTDRILITKKGDSYYEFPEHPGLELFDVSDRKFIAVANAHADKRPVLQATDSKWWKWRQALIEVGISVFFLCPEYVKPKSEKKLGK